MSQRSKASSPGIVYIETQIPNKTNTCNIWSKALFSSSYAPSGKEHTSGEAHHRGSARGRGQRLSEVAEGEVLVPHSYYLRP